MFKKAMPFVMKVVTPLHAGSGQDLGIVDLPIQRERHTGFPKVEASGLKGCIRDFFSTSKASRTFVDIVFGPEKSGDYAGALGFTDARLLLFPVKSAKGVFAWITCPRVLSSLTRDLKLVSAASPFTIPIISDNCCLTAEKTALAVKPDAVILEEYCLKASEQNIPQDVCDFLVDFTEIENLSQQLLIVSDDDFKDFVNLSTEVITRTKINPETGTVQDRHLFTEEYLPVESVLYSLAIASAIFTARDQKDEFVKDYESDHEAVLAFWQKNMPVYLQIGGNATIGKGLVEITVKSGVTNESN